MKTMIITGGSRGIGAATARLAATWGYRVVVNYYCHKTAADAVVSDIRTRGGTAVAVQADVADAKSIISLFEQTIGQFGQLDALVNNAGILETQRKLVHMDSQRLSRIFKINVTGPFLCAREAIRYMALSRGGHGGSIVNVSSIASKTGAPGEYIDYAASKAALDAMTIGLSKEIAVEGIRVNGVRPAFIYTDIHKNGGEPDRIERLKPGIPLGRGGEPEEVAEAILWLASEKSSYSTGTFIDISGGK